MKKIISMVFLLFCAIIPILSQGQVKVKLSDYSTWSKELKGLTLIFWGLSEKFINSEKEKLSISNTS